MNVELSYPKNVLALSGVAVLKTESGVSEIRGPFAKIMTSEQLRALPMRIPNFELENQLLNQLARQAAANADDLLQALTDLTVAMHPEVSACISLKGSGDETDRVRWVAMSGTGQNWRNPTKGQIVFPQDLQAHQVLCLPLGRPEMEVGHLWVIFHSEKTLFDQEDLRLLRSVLPFGAIAVQLREAAGADQRTQLDDHNSFIAKLSHDMRSPLGAIIGFSDLLRDEDLSRTEQIKFVGVISRNAQNLLQMIDRLLDSSQVPALSIVETHVVSALKGVKILVVDDLADNRALLHLILRSSGAHVDFAHDGEEAVRKALADRYDVIVMDIQMPVMDGYEALARIRERGCFTPVVALTANATLGQREIALGKGFHGFSNKPIQRDTFVDMLAKLATLSGQQADSKVSSVATDSAKLAAGKVPTILVVEDDSDVRELIEFVTNEAGARTQVASTGHEALRILDTGLTPDLVFLDLTLPDLSGAEIMACIRKNESLRNTKVILLSGKDNLAAHAKEIGASGSLMKPFDVAQIENLIAEFAR